VGKQASAEPPTKERCLTTAIARTALPQLPSSYVPPGDTPISRTPRRDILRSPTLSSPPSHTNEVEVHTRWDRQDAVMIDCATGLDASVASPTRPPPTTTPTSASAAIGEALPQSASTSQSTSHTLIRKQVLTHPTASTRLRASTPTTQHATVPPLAPGGSIQFASLGENHSIIALQRDRTGSVTVAPAARR
jgi:hypothetical protein